MDLKDLSIKYNLSQKTSAPQFRGRLPKNNIKSMGDAAIKTASAAAAALGIASIALAKSNDKPLMDENIKSVLKENITPHISAETYFVVRNNFMNDTVELDKYIEYEVKKYIDMHRFRNPEKLILLKDLFKEIVLERINNQTLPKDFSDIPFLKQDRKLNYSDLILSKKLLETCVKKGMSFNDIASLTNCHISHVQAKAKEYGVLSQKLVYRENVKNLSNYTDEIVNEYENGTSIEKLMQKYNVSVSSITNFLKKHGVKIREQNFVNITEDELRKCLNAGMTTKEMGEYFSCCPQTIANKLAKLGLKTKRQSEIGKYDDKLTKENLKACIEKGMNIREIAKLYDSSRPTVARKIRFYGLATEHSAQIQRLAAIDNKEFEKCFNQGMSILAIARHFNCSWRTVVNRIKQSKSQDLDVEKLKSLAPEEIEEKILEACLKNEELAENDEIMELADFVSTNLVQIKDNKNLTEFVALLESTAERRITVEEFFEADAVKNMIILLDADNQKKEDFKILCDDYSKLITKLSKQDNKFLYDIALKTFPSFHDDESLKSANYILDVCNNLEKSVHNAEREIAYWYMSKKQDKILKEAEEFGIGIDGILNKERAGQYLVNAAVYKKYLATGDTSGYPACFLKVLKDYNLPEGLAIRNLVRIEDWKNNSDKTLINDFLAYFDEKGGSIEKAFINQYLENFYLDCDTLIPVELENGQNHVATFSAKAKRSIVEHNKFPNCIDYLAKFEDVMHRFARKKQDSGIKFCSNSRISWYEVKIFTWADRLQSSSNDLYFDIYKPQHR